MFTIKTSNELMGKIHRGMRRFFEFQMKKYGITPPQFEVLISLWTEDGLVLSELSKRLSRDGPTITGIIDRMEKKGLVRRERSTTDRRVIMVFSTPKATKMKEALTKLQNTAGKDIIENFTDENIKTLEQLLTKLLTNIENKILPSIKQNNS
jgi:DNA-binding MarR family transcriptional regulator